MECSVDRLAQRSYDLVVIGGGIAGAFAAWDAALRGLSVALLERADFGGATSANSQRIIHGGLRYVQSLDLARMRRSIRERRALLRIAPHLVQPMPCLLPTSHRGMNRRRVLDIACRLNDLISTDRNRFVDDPQRHIPPARMISREECLRLVPGIRAEGLTGGAVWYDAQVRSAERLVLACVDAATKSGAVAANYVEVVGKTSFDGQGLRLVIEDRLAGRRFDLQARMVLNAAGPWVAQVLSRCQVRAPDRLPREWVKGTCLVTRSLTNGVALALAAVEAVHARGLLFVTPWNGQALVGTTYRAHRDGPDACQPTEAEVDELLRGVNTAYPAAQLRRSDVCRVHVGLLPAEHGRLCRDDSLVDHRQVGGPEYLLSMVGVKFTTARALAQRAIDRVCARLDRSRCSTTETTPLPGGRIDSMSALVDGVLQSRPASMAVDSMCYLAETYGAEYPRVLRYVAADPRLAEPVVGSTRVPKAAIVHAAREEAARTLSDVIYRRTELGAWGAPCSSTLRECATLMAGELEWGAQRIEYECHQAQRVLSQPDAPVSESLVAMA